MSLALPLLFLMTGVNSVASGDRVLPPVLVVIVTEGDEVVDSSGDEGLTCGPGGAGAKSQCWALGWNREGPPPGELE